MAKIYNSKILDFSSTPVKKPEGQFWYDATNKVLKRSDGTAFSPINVENNYIDNNATTLSKKLESIDTSLSNVVHKTGDEQIAGNKTFSDSISLATTNDFSTSCTILSDSITIQSGDDSSQNSTSIGSNGLSVNGLTNITGLGFSTMPLASGEDILLLSSGGTTIDSDILLPNRKPVFIGSKVETVSLEGNIDPSTGEGYNLHFGVGYEYDGVSNTVSETPVIKGSLVDSSVSSNSLDTHIPTSKAVYDAISSKQDSLAAYSETADGSEVTLNTSNFNLESVDAYIKSSNRLDLLAGSEGDVSYAKISVTNPNVAIYSIDGAITLYNYYSNEYDSATLRLEEGQITLDSREDILFNLSQYGSIVPVKLSMHLEGELLDIPKVELTGIDRLNVAETIKVNNKPVALAEDLNNKQDKLSYYTEDDSGSVSINAGHILSLNSIEGFSLSDTYNNRITASGPSGILFSTGVGNTSKYFRLSYDGNNDFINAAGIDNLSINNSIKINNEDVLTTSSLNSINSDLTALKTLTNGITVSDNTTTYAGTHGTQIGSTSSDHYQTVISAVDNVTIANSWGTGIVFGDTDFGSYSDVRIYGDTLTFDCDALKFKDEDVLTTSALNGYIKENTNALVSGIYSNSSSPLQIYSTDPNTYGEGNNINISGGYYGITTIAGDGDMEADHPRLIIDPSTGISLLHKDVVIDTTNTITGNPNTDADVRITTNELVLNAPKVSGTLVATDVSESHTEKPDMLVTAQAVYWALDNQRVNLTNAINDAKLTAGAGVSISSDNVISVDYPKFLDIVTSEYTASTSLNSFLPNNNYAVTCGKIVITPSINNVGPIYFGEDLTSASGGFPIYPDQVVTLNFNDLTAFKCYAASSGDKFNYIMYVGTSSVDSNSSGSGSISSDAVTLTSPNGISYRLSITDDGVIQVDPA